MSAQHTPAPVAYDSAYPGSMFEKPHGEYVRRADPASLAAALLEGIAERDRELADVRAALAAAQPCIDKLDGVLEALEDAAVALELCAWEDGVMVNQRAEDAANDIRAAIAKATGSVA